MEKKQDPMKANRILYLIVVGVLVIAALVIGLTAAFRRDKAPDVQLPSQDVSEEPEGPTPDSKPEPETPKPTVYLAPTEGVISQKHDLSAPVFSITMNEWRTHNGLDIATTLGAPVKASAAGTVKEIADHMWLGKSVLIDHGNGVVSVYRNLAEQLPEGLAVGQTVSAGQVIGNVGESAWIETAEEPHLHFEMEVDGAPVDPLSYISKESYEASLRLDESFES